MTSFARLLARAVPAALCVAVVLGCSTTSQQSSEPEYISSEQAAELKGEFPFYAVGPVARIDGHYIGPEAYNEAMRERLEEFPEDLPLPPHVLRPSFGERTTESVIEEYLVDRALDEAEIEVTDEEIEQAYIDRVERTGGKDEFEYEVERRGLTVDEIREDLPRDVRREKYLEMRYDLEPTDDESRAEQRRRAYVQLLEELTADAEIEYLEDNIEENVEPWEEDSIPGS